MLQTVPIDPIFFEALESLSVSSLNQKVVKEEEKRLGMPLFEECLCAARLWLGRLSDVIIGFIRMVFYYKPYVTQGV